ncbi:YciI family protein [Flavivirga eckloniae]|uniref:YCII-related domain-containing protein n=1 Tax=Flavivirga eckloniae TaxID=1803846 RepID=A0A2K9PUN3_9FLAO|nr:YciI family protein [Flavivirga eckloniae]AUP80780.1 hypothetical protein C1H87_19495 [Flavivirga eckloniae]
MKKFMIFIKDDMQNVINKTPEQQQESLKEYMAWIEDYAKTGNYIGSDPIEPNGKYITTHGIKSDGPFIESKEAISGYVLIQAKTIEDAVSFGGKCPVIKSGGAIEVRPIMGM